MVGRPTLTDSDKKRRLKKGALLSAYAVTGNITGATKAAGICRDRHYEWLKEDEEYAAQFEQVKGEACDVLVVEARRRAAEGLKRYKFHQGKPIFLPGSKEPYFEHEYSDTLLIFLLKAGDPATYREKIDHKLSGEVHVKVIILEDAGE